MPKENQPNIPEELKQKFKQLKSKVDKFKEEILKKFDKYIIGITLLPPKNIEREKQIVKEEENRELTEAEIEQIKKQINLLVLIDDSDSKKMSKFELKDKLSKIIEKTATDIDVYLKPQAILLSELKEACFDGRYEYLQLIAISAIIHDPNDLLAALKISEIHKNMVIKKFEKYVVSYVAAGSLFRGEKAHDIDVYIVIDDTDVKKMSRIELKDKLRAIIISQGYEAKSLTGIDKQFHIQTYILTDFWDAVKDAHPVMFTFLRDGVPLYDRGLFVPWKLLLEQGRIRPSPEAIDMQMDIGERLLERVNNKMLGIVGEDLYYAALNPAQAALMLYGLNPPTPAETIKLMHEIFVKKEKMLEQKYVDTIEKLYKCFKDIEHNKIKEISGQELDNLLKETGEYLKRIKKLFIQIEKRKDRETISDMYDACVAVTKDVFDALNIKLGPNIEKEFKEKLVEQNQVPEKFLKILKNIIKAKNQKLTKAENEKIKRESRLFLKTMLEFIQRHRDIEIEKAKIRFKYGDKLGEVLLLDKVAFVIDDIEAKEKQISKATITAEGKLTNIEKSDQKELEECLNKTKIQPKIFIKEPLFKSLEDIFKKNIEILISY